MELLAVLLTTLIQMKVCSTRFVTLLLIIPCQTLLILSAVLMTLATHGNKTELTVNHLLIES